MAHKPARHIPELTGLRGIAVGMVVLGHSGNLLPPPPHWLAYARYVGDIGYTGVQIFFVLSGFLITRLLMREYETTRTISFRAFYRRRLLRISPAFYGYLAILALLAAVGSIDISWQELVVSGTYLWNYGHLLGIDTSFGAHPAGVWYVGHTWSLALEEQFYWVWPGLFLLLSRRRLVGPALAALVVVVPLIRIASYFWEPNVRDQLRMMFHTGMDTILVGCFLAAHEDMLISRLRRPVTSPAAFVASMAALLFIMPLVETRLRGLWSATYGATFEAALIGFILLCILAQPGNFLCSLLRGRVLTFIGLISYSLYLWQQLFVPSDSPFFLGLPLNIAEALVAAALSYVLIERPFLRMKDKTANRIAEPIPAPSG